MGTKSNGGILAAMRFETPVIQEPPVGNLPVNSTSQRKWNVENGKWGQSPLGLTESLVQGGQADLFQKFRATWIGRPVAIE